MQKSLISLVIPVGKVSANSVSLYFQQRVEEGDLNGLWEFPGGKIEASELPVEAARREYKEECQIDVKELVQFKTFSFDYEDRSLCFYSFLTRCYKPVATFKEFEFDLDTGSKNFEDTFPAANHELIDQVVEYLTTQAECGEFEKIWK